MTILDFISLLGGVGLFLYGMTLMSSGLKKAAGDQLRNILERATSNKAISVVVGIVVTILIQSSSATDMMVISFVNSGLMTLAQAVGVIMGEFLVSKAGLGYLIVYGSQVFNMDLVMAAVLMLAAAAVVMYEGVLLLEHWLKMKMGVTEE